MKKGGKVIEYTVFVRELLKDNAMWDYIIYYTFFNHNNDVFQ